MMELIDTRTKLWAAAAVAKAGLTGRAGLSAFFLEDLLAPIDGLTSGAKTGAP